MGNMRKSIHKDSVIVMNYKDFLISVWTETPIETVRYLFTCPQRDCTWTFLINIICKTLLKLFIINLTCFEVLTRKFSSLTLMTLFLHDFNTFKGLQWFAIYTYFNEERKQCLSNQGHNIKKKVRKHKINFGSLSLASIRPSL